MLGPLLFLLFVNDLPEWIVGNLKMFTDDTIHQAVEITVKSEKDSATLQTDVDSLTAWSNRWLLKFNASKCKLMHIGHKFPTEYYMEDNAGGKVKIEETTMEKDLGIYITSGRWFYFIYQP